MVRITTALRAVQKKYKESKGCHANYIQGRNMRLIRAYSDGACDRTTGYMHVGIYAETDEGDVICCEHKGIRSDSGSILPGSCNEAEFYALLDVMGHLETFLSATPDAAAATVILHTDSMLLYKQVSQEWKINTDTLYYLVKRVRQKLLEHKSWRLKHIPREENRIADSLSSEGCLENPRRMGNVDFGRLNVTETTATAGVNTSFMTRFFPQDLAVLKKKLIDAIDARDIEAAYEYTDSIIRKIQNNTLPKTTPYLDRVIQNTLTKLYTDFKQIEEQLLLGNIKGAEEIAEEYRFQAQESELIYDKDEINNFSEIREKELCLTR